MEEMAAKEHERPPQFWGANGKRCGALRETLVERWASQRGYAGGDGEGEGLGAAWDEVAEGKRLSSEVGVLHYALCAGIRSCQTRLVLGAYVHDPQAGEARPQYPNPNKTLSRHYFYGNPCGSQRDLALRCEHLQRALERVGRMAFVGVTDRWNPSVCLFHATFGGEPHPTLLREFRHVSHDDKDNDAKRALEERLRDADGWDTALFVHVETLFNARLAMYGVPEEARPRPASSTSTPVAGYCASCRAAGCRRAAPRPPLRARQASMQMRWRDPRRRRAPASGRSAP